MIGYWLKMMKFGTKLKKIHEAYNFITCLFMKRNYMKTKVKEFNSVVNINFWGDEAQK